MRGNYPDPTDTIRNMTVKWSDSKADYVYTLITLFEYESGERQRDQDTTGDKDWAKRIAKHYGLEIPKVEK